MAYSTDSDQTDALLKCIENGESGALENILRLHRDYLRRVVNMRMEPALMTRVDASDIVQETQVVVAKRIDDFLKRRPTSFRLWIRRKALEQLIDQRRKHIVASKRSVYKEQEMSDISSIAIARRLLADTPSKVLQKIEIQEQVQKLLKQLSGTNQEILTLRHAEGLTNNEVADLLEIPPNTVRQRYGRALRNLHQLLTENNISIDGTAF